MTLISLIEKGSHAIGIKPPFNKAMIDKYTEDIAVDSWRTLLGFQAGRKAFFLYLFPKNGRDNIEENEMKALKRLTKYYLTLKPGEIKTALQCGELNEVNCDEKGT